MATTTMHFGPEWMRKTPSSRPSQPDLPANPSSAIAHNNPHATPVSGSSTYSALVTPTTAPPPENRDVAHPFRYSKEDMIRIYKEGGGRGGLGLEVERWEGIVRETSADPVGLKEPGEGEKKVRFLVTVICARFTFDIALPVIHGIFKFRNASTSIYRLLDTSFYIGG
jgi:PERQ amino acid-rich with GYF domain-containing protein